MKSLSDPTIDFKITVGKVRIKYQQYLKKTFEKESSFFVDETKQSSNTMFRFAEQ